MGAPDHHFNPIVAQQYGVDVAVFLHNIFHWLKHNEAYKKNFYEGRYWTYNSLAAFCEVHPYWSRRQIERIALTCKKEGLLLTGCFNKDQRDRTTWYTLSDKALSFFEDNVSKLDGCISPFGEMHLPDQGQSFHETVTPLPDNRPDNRTNNNLPIVPPEGDKPAKKQSRRREPKQAPDWKPERFEGFWALYPLKKSKQAAIRAWDRLKPDDALLAVMGRALQRQIASDDWQRGFGIPYPATWINGQRWTDEDEPLLPTSGGQPLPPERFGWD